MNILNDQPKKPMGLAEARDVMWLRNNHRPLGELLDEGYLNMARLQWAAAKAYDPRLKEAAQVLLDSQKQVPSNPEALEKATTPDSPVLQTRFDVGITMEDARATLWPFRPFRDQPMGKLVEARQLSLKDLGYAFENAWHERVRRAASVLMLARLDQAVREPSPSAGPLNVLSGGRSYPLKQQFRLTLMQGLLSGAAVTISLVMLVWVAIGRLSVRPSRSISELIASPSGEPTIALGLLLIVVFTAALVWLAAAVFDRIINGLDRRIGRYRQGQEGEDTVLETIRQTLDGDWSLFRNLTLPGLKGTDIDVVLVGPPGVWVLEIKALSGEYRNIGDRWEFRAGRRWHVSRANPSRQAQRNAVRLANFLKADDIRQWVSAAVVWVNQEDPLAVEDPATSVWSLDRLPDELGNLWDREPVSAATRTQILEKLRRLCQEGDRRPLAAVGNQE